MTAGACRGPKSLGARPVRRVLLTTPLLLMVTGCAQYWAKPGGTPDELAAAKDNCEAASLEWFPLAPQSGPLSQGYIVPLTTNCVSGPDGPHCVAVGGGFISPGYTEFDLNQPARYNAYQACLMERGWRRAKDKQEADAIMRRPRVERPLSEAAMRGARAFCETLYRRAPNAARPGVPNGVSPDAFNQCVTTRAHQIDGS
jgi:hypothetical protein